MKWAYPITISWSQQLKNLVASKDPYARKYLGHTRILFQELPVLIWKTKWKTYIVSLRRLLEIIKRKHAPINVKKVIHNHDPFTTKDLRKEIMKKSKLENNFCKNWCNCKYQGNRFVNLLKKTKSIYFKNLNVRRTTDNKTFRQLNSTRITFLFLSFSTRWHHGHTDKNKNTEHQN